MLLRQWTWRWWEESHDHNELHQKFVLLSIFRICGPHLFSSFLPPCRLRLVAQTQIASNKILSISLTPRQSMYPIMTIYSKLEFIYFFDHQRRRPAWTISCQSEMDLPLYQSLCGYNWSFIHWCSWGIIWRWWWEAGWCDIMIFIIWFVP